MFDLIILFAGGFGGAVAAITGFGIGSLLTPAMAMTTDARIAVAAVSVPHMIGTTIRYWEHRRDVDWSLLRHFGFASAAGGVVGAVLNSRMSNTSLEAVFGALLIFAGTSQLTGLAARWRLKGALAEAGGSFRGSSEDSSAIKGASDRPRCWGSRSTRGDSSPRRRQSACWSMRPECPSISRSTRTTS